uniref:YqaJ viral recombinase domain-containing protein n=2 Tax=Cacopsylla melanoneura TaxID=428564 RepID=A0A8D8X2M5_9HEMI
MAFFGWKNFGPFQVTSSLGHPIVGRNSTNCVVRGVVTPETSVNNTAYKVTVSIKEGSDMIEQAMCHGCQGATSGCKHVIAFLFWLHRRSEEPSRTEVTCYWKKPVLSDIKRLEPLRAAEMGGPSCSAQQTIDSEACFQEIVGKLKTLNIKNQLTPYIGIGIEPSLYDLIIHRSIFKFKEADGFEDAELFQSYLVSLMSSELCNNIEKETICQSECKLWHEFRFGRVTASKIHEAVHCKKTDGSLVESILGARRLKDNAHLERGRVLEKSVLQVVEKELKTKIEKCGLFLNSEWPVIGASPDGLNNTHIFEVKCPASEKTVTNYVKNGSVATKYMYQMQIQMFFAGKENGYFCVASPDFESTRNVQIVPVVLDRALCTDILTKAVVFWSNTIFPVLFKMV